MLFNEKKMKNLQNLENNAAEFLKKTSRNHHFYQNMQISNGNPSNANLQAPSFRIRMKICIEAV